MSDKQPPPDFWDFMRGIYPLFAGTYFIFNEKGYNVSRRNDELWIKMLKEHERAKSIDDTIAFDIPFCIAYQNAFNTLVCEEIFGWSVKEAFHVPKNVQDFFKYRTVLQSDQKAGVLSSGLQDLSSKITELKALLERSLDYQQQLVAEVEQFRRDLSDLGSKFQEADKRVKALTNLMNATREVKSLFGRDLAVLQPDFFPVAQDCEKNLRIYSDQMRNLKAHMSGKDMMLSEQSAAIAQIDANLRALYLKQREAESNLRGTRKEIFQELSRFEGDVLPHQLLKYVEESRLHSNKQEAAIVLANHFKKFADRSFAGSRIESAPTACSICDHSKPNYFMFSCGHGPFCDTCVSRLKSISNTCPTCRQPITSHKPLDLFARRLFMQ